MKGEGKEGEGCDESKEGCGKNEMEREMGKDIEGRGHKEWRSGRKMVQRLIQGSTGSY